MNTTRIDFAASLVLALRKMKILRYSKSELVHVARVEGSAGDEALHPLSCHGHLG
eukprot:CAMPEP_0169296140 /NCGR_PEP_ID=MMETSP1016-20121227/64966_1 /TAXON_ID=342587 /ORGANISM="Karlodinium micrum, Strain CCMP2283" /LENGTH=54 /DNA_ID=CAMNT_0009387481 /DNA_START=102 /DNA_END=263 /DNA_ORIENTATION=-